MASRGQSLTICYVAWNSSTNAGATADVANHTLRWVKDGTSAAPTNAASEVDSVNAPGVYKLTLTGAEATCDSGVLCGKSSTANVSIIPVPFTFEQLPTALPGAADGLFIAGSNAATTAASLTVTGAFGVSGGVTFSNSNLNSPGMTIAGNGSGAGISAIGGATGHGAILIGGSTSGDGLHCHGSAAGDGIHAEAHGVNQHGFHSAGVGTGSGIHSEGGATGAGISAIGGTTSGDGLICTVTSGVRLNAGNISVDLQTIKTQAVTCAAGVAISPFVGNATAAIVVDASGHVTAGTVSDKTGYALSTAGVQAIWDALTSALTTVGSIGKKLADWVLGSDNKVLLSTDAQTGVVLPRVTLVDTTTTNTDMRGTDNALLAASYTTPPTAAAIATGVWTDTTAGDFATLGSPGKILVSQLGGAFTTTSSSVFTTAALANAPGGGGSVTVGDYAAGKDPATLVLDALAASHNTANTIGAKINSAASAGDPWSTAQPGSYVAGSFGYLVATALAQSTSWIFPAASYTAPALPATLGTPRNVSNVRYTKTVTQNDLRTAIADQLIDAATNSPINLTGSTVAFRMILQSDKTVKVNNSAATITDGPNGKVAYSWTGTDLSVAGLYWGWWIVTTGGKTEHFPGDGEIMTVKVVAAE